MYTTFIMCSSDLVDFIKAFFSEIYQQRVLVSEVTFERQETEVKEVTLCFPGLFNDIDHAF